MRNSTHTHTSHASHPPSQTLRVEVSRAALMTLRKEAAARDTSVDALVAKLIDTIVTDRLIEAVLDDKPPVIAPC
jgi:hypothetical protein